MATIFTRIIEGEIPGTFVWRDHKCVAFMSINPLRPGHVLVVPIEEVDHWIDCSPELVSHLMAVSRTIGQALNEVYEPNRVGMLIVGDEVPHAHLHIVPIERARDLDFANAAPNVGRGELESAAAEIRAALEAQGAAGVSD